MDLSKFIYLPEKPKLCGKVTVLIKLDYGYITRSAWYETGERRWNEGWSQIAPVLVDNIIAWSIEEEL